VTSHREAFWSFGIERHLPGKWNSIDKHTRVCRYQCDGTWLIRASSWDGDNSGLRIAGIILGPEPKNAFLPSKDFR
jgi:hypothetical protein